MNSDDTPKPSGKSCPEDTNQALQEKAREALADEQSTEKLLRAMPTSNT
jgi:hypothetical protein